LICSNVTEWTTTSVVGFGGRESLAIFAAATTHIAQFADSSAYAQKREPKLVSFVKSVIQYSRGFR
jgi:hypothetical protein